VREHSRDPPSAIRHPPFAIRYVTFPVFLFGMYARHPIRDPFYLISILSFSGAQSAFFGRLPFSRPPRSLPRFFVAVPQIPGTSLPRRWAILRKYDTLDSPPLPTLIRHAARERRTARSSGARQTTMAAARWSANPQSNNIQLNFSRFAGIVENSTASFVSEIKRRV